MADEQVVNNEVGNARVDQLQVAASTVDPVVNTANVSVQGTVAKTERSESTRSESVTQEAKEEPSPLSSIIERLKQKDISKVVLIDDVFDGEDEPWNDISDADRSQFISVLQEDENKLAEFNTILERNADAEVRVLNTSLLGSIWKHGLKGDFALLNEHFEDLTLGVRSDTVSGRDADELLKIRKNLELLDLEVSSCGENEPFNEFDADLIFVDWHLGPVGRRRVTIEEGELPPAVLPIDSAIAASKRKVESLWSNWPQDKRKPFVVLMSNLKVNADSQNEFIMQTTISGGLFHFAYKPDISQRTDLLHLISALTQSWSLYQELSDFQQSVERAATDAAHIFAQQIRLLRREDYTYIQKLSLQNEGQPLGDYLLWLQSCYLAQLFRRNALLQEPEKALNKKIALDLAPLMAAPSSKLAEVYESAIFDNKIGDVTVHPRAETIEEKLPEEAYLDLGDLFLSEGEIDNSSLTKDHKQAAEGASVDGRQVVYLLVSAACDLAFSPDPKDERLFKRNLPIILLRGTLWPIEQPVPNHVGVHTELFLLNEKTYRILWDSKRFHSVLLKDFFAWRNSRVDKPYIRIARMRLPYVLEVQHEFTSSLARIATPVAPPILNAVRAQFMYRNADNKAIKLTDLSTELVSLMVYREEGTRALRYRITYQGCLILNKLIEQVVAGGKADDIVRTGTDWTHLNKLNEKFWSKIDIINSPFELKNAQLTGWTRLSPPLGVARNHKDGDVLSPKGPILFLNICDPSLPDRSAETNTGDQIV